MKRAGKLLPDTPDSRIDVAAAARDALEALERWRRTPTLSGDPVETFDQVAAEALAFLRRVLEADDGVRGPSLAPSELAQRWGVSAATVRRLVESGDLTAFNAAQGTVARWRIPEGSALRFALERSNRKADPVFSAPANHAGAEQPRSGAAAEQ